MAQQGTEADKADPGNYREAIHERVDLLAEYPDCPSLDVKELRGHEYGYRLRVGRYRVLFDFDNGIRVISIQEVRKRDERTY